MFFVKFLYEKFKKILETNYFFLFIHFIFVCNSTQQKLANFKIDFEYGTRRTKTMKEQETIRKYAIDIHISPTHFLYFKSYGDSTLSNVGSVQYHDV